MELKFPRGSVSASLNAGQPSNDEPLMFPMPSSLLILLLFLACAGPSTHRQPSADSALEVSQPQVARVPVATTLTPEDPLSAANCALPTAPTTTCPEVETEPQRKEEKHQHHHPGSPIPKADLPPEAPSPVKKQTNTVKVVDPVCKMKIDPTQAKGGSLRLKGTQYWFCSSSCRRTFQAQNPEAK